MPKTRSLHHGPRMNFRAIASWERSVRQAKRFRFAFPRVTSVVSPKLILTKFDREIRQLIEDVRQSLTFL